MIVDIVIIFTTGLVLTALLSVYKDIRIKTIESDSKRFEILNEDYIRQLEVKIFDLTEELKKKKK